MTVEIDVMNAAAIRSDSEPPAGPLVSLSIVSHGQSALVAALLNDIETCVVGPVEVILTLNVPEAMPFSLDQFSFPVRLITNGKCKGFGENHNQAFSVSSGQYFVVLNPDIRLNADPLPALIEALGADVGVVAPLVVNSAGRIEDSARRFPTPLDILRKAISGKRPIDYSIGTEIIDPDWVAGMFMLFPRHVFSVVGGFDQRYFLYYEDVDICARMRVAGFRICLVPKCTAIHDARRQSHRNLRYLRWHLVSMLRFFLYHPRLTLLPLIKPLFGRRR